jgi:hypothetical protein
MSGLEREMERLATTVDHLAAAVERDRTNAELRRSELLELMREADGRQESLVRELSAQIKSLVQQNLDSKTALAAQQAQWGLVRWALTATVGLCTVLIAYQSGRENARPEPTNLDVPESTTRQR